MRQDFLAVLIFAVASCCFAQGGKPYSSVGGYGSALYPGVGHAPNANPSSLSGGVSRGGARGGAYGGGGHSGHPAHGRTTIVPYPVIVGGGYYNGYPAGINDPYQEMNQQNEEASQPPLNSYGAPSVVINQTFIPEHASPIIREYGEGVDPSGREPSGLRVYEGPKPPTYPNPAAKKSDDTPTLYLIAFRDHTIVQALGYWVESGALHYVSAEHTVNQASMDLIDRDLSQRLNDERQVEFKLPKI